MYIAASFSLDTSNILDIDGLYTCKVLSPAFFSTVCNLKTLKLKDGSELSVGKKFYASFKAEKKEEGIQWLRDNGLGDIVDNNITVTFGQGEDNKAVEYASLARERGYEPTQQEKVHHARLSAVMREWKEKGNEVPVDLFNTLEGNRTSVTNKK